MDKKQLIPLVLVVLVLLYFLNHMTSAATATIIPTTTGASVNRYSYNQPTTSSSYYVSGGKSNPYKAQYYN